MKATKLGQQWFKLEVNEAYPEHICFDDPDFSIIVRKSAGDVCRTALNLHHLIFL